MSSTDWTPSERDEKEKGSDENANDDKVNEEKVNVEEVQEGERWKEFLSRHHSLAEAIHSFEFFPEIGWFLRVFFLDFPSRDCDRGED
jgi:hypothetical protein